MSINRRYGARRGQAGRGQTGESRSGDPASLSNTGMEGGQIRSRERPLESAGYVLVGLWILVLFDVQWLLANYGLLPLLRLPSLLFLVLVLILAIQVPARAAWQKRWQWHAPMLLFVGSAASMVPFALNAGFALQSTTLFMLYWTLMVGTLVIVDSVRRAERLVFLYGLSFLWWGLWGGLRGGVSWHYTLFNHDGFGALMVVGVGLCAFLTVAAPKKTKFRLTMAVATGLCITGVVASFARGAFLAAVAVAALVWFRSQHKGRALLIGAGAAVVVVTAANVLHEVDFWAEMESAFTHGTTEGTNEDRWVLWNAALQVFKERPVFGVGPRNFGPFAAEFFNVGDLPEGGYGYTNNPGMLYNRSLHNVYVQILSEHGLVGSFAYLWILASFWRRNVALRSREAGRRWKALGGRLELRPLALALEAGMVGYLIPAAVYGLIAVHWFYTIVALNLLIHSLVFGKGGREVATRRGGQQSSHGFTAATPARLRV